MDWNDQYCVSMMFAIYALPVFDTLRVMTVRMIHGNSPFKADRTHLHHMYVDLGFPHIMVTTILLGINAVIIGIWYLTATYMDTINGQFFVTIAVAVVMVPGVYFVLNGISKRHPELFARFQDYSKTISRRPVKNRDRVRELIDGNVYRRVKMNRAKAKKEKAAVQEA